MQNYVFICKILNQFYFYKSSCKHFVCLSDKYCQPEDFTDYLYKQFSKLEDAAGYELLKTRESLEIIPCPNEGHSAKYLSNSTLGIGVGIIYIRPLQKDLSLEVSKLHRQSMDKCLLRFAMSDFIFFLYMDKYSEGKSGQGHKKLVCTAKKKNLLLKCRNMSTNVKSKWYM